MSLYDRIIPPEALSWRWLTAITDCPAYVDDGRTLLCAECGWWSSSHGPMLRPIRRSWLPWRKRR